jgi:integrase/recombinase XerC
MPCHTSRTRGPRPGHGKVLAPRDVCPDTGLVRLSYGQARALLDAHTVIAGVPGRGWDLHEYRHSGLTYLGEAGASLLMLMPQPLAQEAGNVRRYFHPSAEAIAKVTSLLAPGDAGAEPDTVRRSGSPNRAALRRYLAGAGP